MVIAFEGRTGFSKSGRLPCHSFGTAVIGVRGLHEPQGASQDAMARFTHATGRNDMYIHGFLQTRRRCACVRGRACTASVHVQ